MSSTGCCGQGTAKAPGIEHMNSIKYSKYLQETSKNYSRISFGMLDHPPDRRKRKEGP
jgi:hypothetical protein